MTEHPREHVAALRDVTLRYGRTTALDSVTFQCQPGTITSLVGGDGAGKSSVLRLLAHLEKAQSGTVTTAEKKRIGYQPATSGVWPALSVIENLHFVADSYRLTQAERSERIAELLERANLSSTSDRIAAQLSRGMRQKLGFSMVMLHQPELLLLNEPTTGLDPVSRFELWKLSSEASANGTTVIFATAYLDEASRASQLIVLDQATVLSQGTLSEVMRSTGAHAEHHSLEEVVVSLAQRSRGITLQAEQPPAHPISDRSQELAELNGVEKRFGNTPVLQNIDFHIHSGEILGLIGANGAGKTTLIRVFLGLEKPSAGRVTLFGSPPSHESKHRIGYVAQGFGLFPTLSAQQNVEFTAAVQHVPVRPLSDIFTGHEHIAAGQLPLGLQRRLAFHCATFNDPDLLILDEPSSGMDPLGRAELWRLARQAAAQGTGIIITTHYLEEAEHCDRVVVLNAGKIAITGTVSEILAGREVTVVRGERWQTAYQQLNAAGLDVSLAGVDIRVRKSHPDAIRAILNDSYSAYEIFNAPASLEETMIELSETCKQSLLPDNVQ